MGRAVLWSRTPAGTVVPVHGNEKWIWICAAMVIVSVRGVKEDISFEWLWSVSVQLSFCDLICCG